ncbi:transcriptional regulator [Chitinophaga parva]|uniref:Transcriptional regulator n=1 Tax=Chitinophaga parva TaxID=2169414 RepID=A0A2T7BHS0_9BACT|nr:helix-turn-helix domain-containing protein [Chitinophaga parva]PUZ25793.1 transcriptional regulator [Chitinophaga parva]
MTAIKKTSTIQENKALTFQQCPVTYLMERIGGYWKPIILFNLLSGPKRYSEIRKSMPSITEKVLIQQLKQLEADSLLTREAKPVVPPYVTYSLTEAGWRLREVLVAMATWSIEDGHRKGVYWEGNIADIPDARVQAS